jgi:hypothetical protein
MAGAMTSLQRYQQAHYEHMCRKFPTVVKDGHYTLPIRRDPRKANGLTKMVIEFLLWNGHRATRIASSGRIIKAPQRQESGISLLTSKYIPGTTRKGTADVSATIKGRSCMFEIKVGNDKASEYQLKEQALERSAGGQYEFIKTFEQFLEWYDTFLLPL